MGLTWCSVLLSLCLLKGENPACSSPQVLCEPVSYTSPVQLWKMLVAVYENVKLRSISPNCPHFVYHLMETGDKNRIEIKSYSLKTDIAMLVCLWVYACISVSHACTCVQGCCSRSVCGGGSGSTVALSVSSSLPAELRTEWSPARPPSPRWPALRRIRILSSGQRDFTTTAEGTPHGENTQTHTFIIAVFMRTFHSLIREKRTSYMSWF